MLSSTSIQYLARKQINIDNWDNCITNAANGLIYSHSFYLDAMCDNWDAFVINDYEAVMPLPWRKKAGIKYLYTPPFIQQLGVTGNLKIVEEKEIVKQLRKRFRYGDILFNYSHRFENIPVESKANYILNLNQPFAKIEMGFSTILKKNLKTAKKNNLQILSSQSHALIIETFRKQYQERIPHVKDIDFNNFSKLCDELLSKNMLVTRIIQNKENEPLAALVLINDNKRIYNILNHITAKGRTAMANHVMLVDVLKEFSEKELLFDFEGSDLTGVKEFYEYFGPANQPYFHYHFNYLPFPLNRLKK